MSEQKHAPLPWHEVVTPGFALGIGSREDEKIVASIPAGSDTGTADRAYIVTACNAFPAMMEACEAAEIWFSGSVLSAQEQYVVGLLRAALEKAGAR